MGAFSTPFEPIWSTFGPVFRRRKKIASEQQRPKSPSLDLEPKAASKRFVDLTKVPNPPLPGQNEWLKCYHIFNGWQDTARYSLR